MTTNRPLARVRSFGDLADWQSINLLFANAGLEPPPTRLRDELVTHLRWARWGQEVSDNADTVRSARATRPTYGDTHYET
jgi:hypothetical protein